MCGIVGILNRDQQRPVDGELLQRMMDIMHHRGPDDSGIYMDENVGLGHRRLSIIDLRTGHQPMIDKDRKRALVYNGEIYNYQTLRADLEKGGARFNTSCDTEVLLHLVSPFETKWLESLNGMFAFAYWDEKSRSLILGRDRLGKKPLYYMDLGDQFVFASEIKALLLHPKAYREVNIPKIPEYLVFRGIAGTETLFKGIYQVPPGHIMVLKPGSYAPESVKYWNEGFGSEIAQYADADKPFEEQFLDIFIDAVRLRLISDVPLGTYNSGGVDSSLVTAIVKSLREGELHTFSVGFEEKSYDESKYAQIVADKLGTTHHALVMNERDYSNTLTEALWHLEEPINHAHTVQILHLSKIAKEFVTVVLTGEGSDEIFAGYPRYRIPKICKILKIFPKELSDFSMFFAKILQARRIIKLLEFVNGDEEVLVINNARFVPVSDFERVASDRDEFLTRHSIYMESLLRNTDLIQRLLHYDQRTYLSSLLMRLDKMSMAASIEARVPFLDYRLIEWSYKIPANVKLKGLVNKWIVKKVGERYLPKSIVYRKKVGFGVPVGNWLKNPKGLGAYLQLLKDKRAKERGYFEYREIDKIIDEHLYGKTDHSELLWGLINLELWHKMFIDGCCFKGVKVI